MSEIKLRGAYEEKEKDDGYSVLVDRLWPRGSWYKKRRLNLQLVGQRYRTFR